MQKFKEYSICTNNFLRKFMTIRFVGCESDDKNRN